MIPRGSAPTWARNSRSPGTMLLFLPLLQDANSFPALLSNMSPTILRAAHLRGFQRSRYVAIEFILRGVATILAALSRSSRPDVMSRLTIASQGHALRAVHAMGSNHRAPNVLSLSCTAKARVFRPLRRGGCRAAYSLDADTLCSRRDAVTLVFGRGASAPDRSRAVPASANS
jgi:hypothetical protein